MHIVYIIACFDNNEFFIKIGRTYNSISQRFSGKKMPYNYVILKSYSFTSLISCSNFEKQLHKKYKKYSYKPLINFKGYTECFDKNLLNKIK